MKNILGLLAAGSVVLSSLLFSGVAFAQSAPTASIQSLTPGNSVLPGNEVSFSISTAGFSSTPSYSVSDSFSGGTVSSSNVNNSGVFTWIPTSADAGTHTLTITVSDSSGETSSVSQQIIVQGPPTVSVQSLSPGASVILGQTVSFTAATSNFTNPSYSLSDSFYNSSVTNSNINTGGGFSWSPLAQDVGTHTITITATDSLGHAASTNQTITVASSQSLTVQSISPGSNVAPGQLYSFTAVPTGLTNPTYSVIDSFSGSSVANADINASGYFAWTPISSETGMHTITVYAIDSYGKTANVSTSVDVTPTATVTTSASALSSAQVQSILSLLQAFGADQSVINNVSAVLGGQTTVAATTPTTTAKHLFYIPLKVGSTGDEVLALQQRLTAEGYYSGPITGTYGGLTRTAVEKYQAAHGLDQLGSVGPGTRAALNQ